MGWVVLEPTVKAVICTVQHVQHVIGDRYDSGGGPPRARRLSTPNGNEKLVEVCAVLVRYSVRKSLAKRRVQSQEICLGAPDRLRLYTSRISAGAHEVSTKSNQHRSRHNNS